MLRNDSYCVVILVKPWKKKKKKLYAPTRNYKIPHSHSRFEEWLSATTSCSSVSIKLSRLWPFLHWLRSISGGVHLELNKLHNSKSSMCTSSDYFLKLPLKSFSGSRVVLLTDRHMNTYKHIFCSHFSFSQHAIKHQVNFRSQNNLRSTLVSLYYLSTCCS